MAKNSESRFAVEWFNVTYRSVLLVILIAVAVVGGGGAYWYYNYIYTPKAEADQAILRAERRLGEASALREDERLLEIVQSAEVALREAREARSSMRFDDSRVAAIRSENLSLKALGLGRGQDEQTRLVRFYRFEGDVRVKKVGEFSWEPANNSMVLQIGDQVKTSSSASAQLIYFDGTVTTIQPGSLLEIRELYENPVTKVRRVREQLSRGEVKASTQDQPVDGSYHEVATEKVTARTDEASEFRVAYDEENRSTEFDAFEGRIEISSPGKKESLVGGERIRAGADGRLSGKELLPGVPRLIAPRDQKVFISEDPSQQKITLTWEAVAGARSYQLSIANRSLFTSPLYDAERSGTTAVLDAFPAGAYFWRVAALTNKGTTGPYSSTRRFRVSSAKIRDRGDTEPPDLEITEFVSIGLMVIVNGQTEPGATLWIDTEKIDVDDDGSFYAVLRMRKEGLNDIRFVAQDTAGNENELVRSAYVEMF